MIQCIHKLALLLNLLLINLLHKLPIMTFKQAFITFIIMSLVTATVLFFGLPKTEQQVPLEDMTVEQAVEQIEKEVLGGMYGELTREEVLYCEWLYEFMPRDEAIKEMRANNIECY